MNGICFLDTPGPLREKLGRDLFGPWEGHIVGCEYDTRRLVRMSLERIGDTFQGAVYPLSAEPAEDEESFEGPVVCQVAPDGDLYVGNLRDSGWGAGQNTGSIVRLRRRSELAPGIAEVKAQRDGFLVRFAQPVNSQMAADAGSYAVSSFRRVSTPEYGGPDVDRQTTRIEQAIVSDDRREVRLKLDRMRPGHVYELHVKNLAESGALFHPAEAYYTLRALLAAED